MERLIRYFTKGVKSSFLGGKIGAEIETSFVDRSGRPITLEQSQKILSAFARKFDAKTVKKGSLVTEVRDYRGNRILYELGWQNIELATPPEERAFLIPRARFVLEQLYAIARQVDAYPHVAPIIESEKDLLVVPDERDAGWVRIDGREALKHLARISAVQFTVPVGLHEAILCLNRLGAHMDWFRKQYPQDQIWRRYIEESHAGYQFLRYGGPVFFQDLKDYCEKLAQHHWVDAKRNKLVPIFGKHRLNIPLYVRSVWWYFRLRRYGDQLCIEVRPLGRYRDKKLAEQLDVVMTIMQTGKLPAYVPQESRQERSSPGCGH